MLSRYPRKLLPPIVEEKVWTCRTLLLTAFHDLIDGVAAHLVNMQKLFINSNDSFTRFHRNDGPLRSWLLRTGKDPDWAEISTMSCAGRLSFVEVF